MHRCLVTPHRGKWIRPTLTPLTYGSFGPHESAFQTTSRSVQPFFAYTAANTPNASQWGGRLQRLRLPLGIGASSNTWLPRPSRVSAPPPPHSSPNSRFYRACERDQHTKRHTETHRQMRPNNNNNNNNNNDDEKERKEEAVVDKEWMS